LNIFSTLMKKAFTLKIAIISGFVASGLLMSSLDSQAQRMTARNRYIQVGVTLSAANYFGDLVPGPQITSFRFKSTRLNLGVTAAKKLTPHIFVRGSLSWARITGDDEKAATVGEATDAGRWQRNLSFRNDIKELAVMGQYYLFGSYKAARRSDINPYVFAGVGVFAHNPKTYYDGNLMAKGWYDLQPLHTEGQDKAYSKVGMCIPLGLGVSYKLSRVYDLSFEIGWRKTFTDYLDDVSGKYADKSDLKAKYGDASWILSDRSIERAGLTVTQGPSNTGELFPYTGSPGHAGRQRGDLTDDDWYIFSGLNLSYILQGSSHRPKFR
jgi:hypothetical protein